MDGTAINGRYRAYLMRCLVVGVVCLAVSGAIALARVRTDAGTVSDATTDRRVFDTADYFTDEQEGALADKIGDIAHRTKTDVVLYTTDESVEDSAVHPEMDAFQREYGFGYGDDWAIIYFNLTTRYIYLTVNGRPARIFDSEGEGAYQDVVDAVVAHRDDEDWYGGVDEALDVVDYRLTYGRYMPSPPVIGIAFVIACGGALAYRFLRERANFAEKEGRSFEMTAQTVRSDGVLVGRQRIAHSGPSDDTGGGGGDGGGGSSGGGGHF